MLFGPRVLATQQHGHLTVTGLPQMTAGQIALTCLLPLNLAVQLNCSALNPSC